MKARSGKAFFILLLPAGLLVASRLPAAEEAGLSGWLSSLTATDPQGIATPLKALIALTVLSIVPSVLLLTTSYPRIVIILSFLRRALGAQDLPSNQVVAGLALILTALTMLPVWKKVHDEAYLPFSRGEIKSPEAALEKAAAPLKEFMLAHAGQKDLELFTEISRGSKPEATTTAEEHGFFVVLPAFVLSELKLAFQMGFLLILPFAVIDLAVSAILLSMGMFMLPPALVSLPLKVLVFVLVDGWNLVVAQIVEGIRVIL